MGRRLREDQTEMHVFPQVKETGQERSKGPFQDCQGVPDLACCQRNPVLLRNKPVLVSLWYSVTDGEQPVGNAASVQMQPRNSEHSMPMANCK